MVFACRSALQKIRDKEKGEHMVKCMCVKCQCTHQLVYIGNNQRSGIRRCVGYFTHLTLFLDIQIPWKLKCYTLIDLNLDKFCICLYLLTWLLASKSFLPLSTYCCASLHPFIHQTGKHGDLCSTLAHCLVALRFVRPEGLAGDKHDARQYFNSFLNQCGKIAGAKPTRKVIVVPTLSQGSAKLW